MIHTQLTARDEAILTTLTHRVKGLSVPQINRTWWPDATVATTEERLKRLRDTGWVVVYRIPVHAINFLPSGRICTWESGMAEPDWSRIESFTRNRWQIGLRCVTAVIATEQTANLVGGQFRWLRLSEATHDLYLSGVYLRFLHERPADASEWIGESRLAAESHGEEGNIPDALIRNDLQPTAIEVVGESYSKPKLRSFHEYCVKRGWRYELW